MKMTVITRLAIVLLTLTFLSTARVLAHGDEVHGSHDASFGGLVMMYIDLHFEVVLGEGGGVSLYYSDASRAPLPAAVVSDVQVDILRDGAAMETVSMSASDAGDYWSGDSTVITEKETIVRVAFVFQGEPVVFELPARIFPSMMEPMPAMSTHEA
ncbi:MAG: hypothetical protein P8J44_10195 [Gammaproteobacteria bacterium]|nr:hypothetical protein [Gammaproteobacteria bacterium]